LDVGGSPTHRTTNAYAPHPPSLRFGVGVRVFSDRALLKQIRTDLARNAMQPEAIARFENVSLEALVAVLQNGLGPAQDPSAPLREFVSSRDGYGLLAWRTSRHHVSKLHIITDAGVALCGTPRRAKAAPVHSGLCQTCMTLAGLDVGAYAT
jgi:hypothetical protein